MMPKLWYLWCLNFGYANQLYLWIVSKFITNFILFLVWITYIENWVLVKICMAFVDYIIFNKLNVKQMVNLLGTQFEQVKVTWLVWEPVFLQELFDAAKLVIIYRKNLAIQPDINKNLNFFKEDLKTKIHKISQFFCQINNF